MAFGVRLFVFFRGIYLIVYLRLGGCSAGALIAERKCDSPQDRGRYLHPHGYRRILDRYIRGLQAKNDGRRKNKYSGISASRGEAVPLNKINLKSDQNFTAPICCLNRINYEQV